MENGRFAHDANIFMHEKHWTTFYFLHFFIFIMLQIYASQVDENFNLMVKPAGKNSIQ